MKILHITSEGYSPVDKMFPFGSYYYLFENEEELNKAIEKFNAWKDSLGMCKNAISSIDNHPASVHVCYEVIIPSKLKEPLI